MHMISCTKPLEICEVVSSRGLESRICEQRKYYLRGRIAEAKRVDYRHPSMKAKESNEYLQVLFITYHETFLLLAAAYVHHLVLLLCFSQRFLIATYQSIERRFFFSFPCNPHRRCVRELSAQNSPPNQHQTPQDHKSTASFHLPLDPPLPSIARPLDIFSTSIRLLCSASLRFASHRLAAFHPCLSLHVIK